MLKQSFKEILKEWREKEKVIQGRREKAVGKI